MNDWSLWTTTTTGTSTTAGAGTWYVYPTTTFPVVTAPSAGHVPSYEAPALAEDELGWLRRRITEVTDLFPAAA